MLLSSGSPFFWRNCLFNRFRLVTSELRTTFDGAKKFFSQRICRKNLMQVRQTGTSCFPVSRGIRAFQAFAVWFQVVSCAIRALGRRGFCWSSSTRKISDVFLSRIF
ncbi:hypothetical protein SZ55_4776 [Pseudomonas sp. FeS53a]|nr:hypothetical protein SZ55_4776 [Pseudomonas sp. FeS53a]